MRPQAVLSTRLRRPFWAASDDRMIADRIVGRDTRPAGIRPKTVLVAEGGLLCNCNLVLNEEEQDENVLSSGYEAEGSRLTDISSGITILISRFIECHAGCDRAGR